MRPYAKLCNVALCNMMQRMVKAELLYYIALYGQNETGHAMLEPCDIMHNMYCMVMHSSVVYGHDMTLHNIA